MITNNTLFNKIQPDNIDYSKLEQTARHLYSKISGTSLPVDSLQNSGLPVSYEEIKKTLFPDDLELNHFISETANVKNLFSNITDSFKSDYSCGLLDIKKIRADFPILSRNINGKKLIWLDNAATTQKPKIVVDTLKNYYENYNSNIHRGAHSLAKIATDEYEKAREKIQLFIGAKSKDEIIFLRGTTEAINLVVQSYGRKNISEGDEILLTNLEHHSNIVPWQMLAQEKKAVIKIIPVNDNGDIMLEEYERLLNHKTKIVAITHISNSIGAVAPVDIMTELAHKYNAKVLIDGAQSVPHIKVNMQKINADFYAFSGHKIFAPTGIGILYGKAELLKEMPPWQGGGSMIKYVSFENTIYNDIPQKFEAGTNNIADAVGLGAAIDYLNSINFEAAAAYEKQLLNYAIDSLSSVNGLRQIGNAAHKISVISFVIDGFRPEAIAEYLDNQGIAVRAGHHCAQPAMQRFNIAGTVRPSLAFYNTIEEIDVLTTTLKQMINKNLIKS